MNRSVGRDRRTSSNLLRDDGLDETLQSVPRRQRETVQGSVCGRGINGSFLVSDRACNWRDGHDSPAANSEGRS